MAKVGEIVGVGAVLTILGISIGYMISNEFGYPYWSVIGLSVTILLAVGLPIVLRRNHSELPISNEDGNTAESKAKSDRSTEKDEVTVEPDSHMDTRNSVQQSRNSSDIVSRENSKYSVGRSRREILEEQANRISDLVTVLEGDIIRINVDSEYNPYKKMLLYVIAARYSYAEEYRESPKVTSEEITSIFNYTNLDVGVFIDETYGVLTHDHGIGILDYKELKDSSFEVEISDLEKAIDWILNDEQTTMYEANLYFGYADLCLSNAKEYCEEIKGIEKEEFRFPPNDEYSGLEFEIKDAIKDIRDYPVVYSDDTTWRDFMRTADAAMRDIEQRSLDGVLHCVNRMEGRLKVLKNRHDNTNGEVLYGIDLQEE